MGHPPKKTDESSPSVSQQAPARAAEPGACRCSPVQNYSFGFAESALAQAAEVPLHALHSDVDAILKANEKIAPVAERLGVPVPRPHLAGFCYTPLAALGAEVVFPKGSEPNVRPLLASAEEIDRLEEPEDYLQAELIQQRLDTLERLKRRRPDAANSIGHNLEGPLTTATLLLGPKFMTLVYDDPERSHRLLDFSVRTASGYCQAITEHLGGSIRPSRRGIPDDFAGLFPPHLFEEFAVPYLNDLYERLQATERRLHSELLRVNHLRYLKDMRIDEFDPSADQYLTPEQLKENCPCSFMLRILSWHVHDMSAKELQEYYRYLATFEPTLISFSLWRLEDEPKVQALFKVARELKGEA